MDLHRRQTLLSESSMLRHLSSAKRVRQGELKALRALPNSRGTTRGLHSSSFPFILTSFTSVEVQTSRPLEERPPVQLKVRATVDGVRVPTLVGLLVAEKTQLKVGILTPLAQASRQFKTLALNTRCA